ncbi:ferredoxin [Rhodococcus sp. NPDC003348]
MTATTAASSGHSSESGTGLRLNVDRSACAGHGLCYGGYPEVLDCDDQGDPVILRDPLDTAAEIDAARAAVQVCPERALTVESV